MGNCQKVSWRNTKIMRGFYEQQDFLMHHGILGQKWGIRRYQNKDGSLTEAGRKRYLTDSGKLNDKGKKRFVDRGDGTYYDATKYARKFGLVGGLIDTARLVKEKKASAAKDFVYSNIEKARRIGVLSTAAIANANTNAAALANANAATLATSNANIAALHNAAVFTNNAAFAASNIYI